ncbi:MAG: hypothetical protein WEF50_13520 [Myxococcota bacterium]
MLGSSARRSIGRRTAALAASLAVVALLALVAHAHDEVQPDAKACAVCAVAHHSGAPIPTQPLVSTPTSFAPLAAPAEPVLASQLEGAKPTARAPPLRTPDA